MLRVRHHSPSTVDNRRKSVGVFLNYLKAIGLADVRAVSRDTIADYQRELLRDHSVGTVRSYLGGVRRFLRTWKTPARFWSFPAPGCAAAQRGAAAAPAHLETVRSAPVVERAGRNAQGTARPGVAEPFYSSGIRREEMARLAVPDVDIRNGFVRKGKGGRDRVVPIGQTACEALARYLKDARSVWLKAPRNPGWTDALWLSPIQPHAPLKKEVIGQIVQRHAHRVLGRNVSPHVWRHSYATHLVANGANIVYVQRLLGHKLLKTTDLYTRVGVPDLKKMLQRAHPGARRTATPPPALTPEMAAHMHSGHKQVQPLKNP